MHTAITQHFNTTSLKSSQVHTMRASNRLFGKTTSREATSAGPGQPCSDAGSNIKQPRSDVDMRSGRVAAGAHKPPSQAGMIEQQELLRAPIWATSPPKTAITANESNALAHCHPRMVQECWPFRLTLPERSRSGPGKAPGTETQLQATRHGPNSRRLALAASRQDAHLAAPLTNHLRMQFCNTFQNFIRRADAIWQCVWKLLCKQQRLTKKANRKCNVNKHRANHPPMLAATSSNFALMSECGAELPRPERTSRRAKRE